LKTTYAFIEEYFGAISSRTQNFKSVINDFTTGKILCFSDGAIKNYKLQALEYIDEIIIYLNESEDRKIKITNKLEPQIEKRVITKEVIKTQLPFGISASFFWTIIAALVSASFILGQNFGSSRFDKEKSDYYEQVKSLQKDTLQLKKLLNEKDQTIR